MNLKRQIKPKKTKTNNTISDISNTKPKSNWELKKDHHTINLCIGAVNDIEEILEHVQTLPWMTRQCLMNFQNEMIWFSPKQGKEENYIEKPNIELSSDNC